MSIHTELGTDKASRVESSLSVIFLIFAPMTSVGTLLENNCRIYHDLLIKNAKGKTLSRMAEDKHEKRPRKVRSRMRFNCNRNTGGSKDTDFCS